jgi:hypothetical protein
MDTRRFAPALGIVFCLLVAGVLAVPYLLVEDGSTVEFYYSSGTVDPLIAGLLCAVAIIVFAAGRQERTDPVTAAGVTLAFGAFVTVVAVLWAISVPDQLVLQLSRSTLMEYHRWGLVLASSGVLASGLWYARALSLI